jgi:O-acetyl-ADP-ribose deacetylase (regulator of RNase III)
MDIGDKRIELIQGDITLQRTDAIVNAANSGLRGGGGVDGAIHRAGGPSIMEECRRIGGCPTGEARVTGAGGLMARNVIHAVGPRWRGGGHGEAELLRSAYAASLDLAADLRLESVSFPSLSTGAYGYPLEQAADIALGVVAGYLRENDYPRKVVFVLFDAETLDTYRRALSKQRTA